MSGITKKPESTVLWKTFGSDHIIMIRLYHFVWYFDESTVDGRVYDNITELRFYLNWSVQMFARWEFQRRFTFRRSKIIFFRTDCIAYTVYFSFPICVKTVTWKSRKSRRRTMTAWRRRRRGVCHRPNNAVLFLFLIDGRTFRRPR